MTTTPDLSGPTHESRRFLLLTPRPFPFNWQLVGLSPEIEDARSRAKMRNFECVPGSLQESRLRLARVPRRWAYFTVAELSNPAAYRNMEQDMAAMMVAELVKRVQRKNLVTNTGVLNVSYWRALVIGSWLQWRPGCPVGEPGTPPPNALRHPTVIVDSGQDYDKASPSLNVLTRSVESVGSGLVWWRGHRVPLDILLERGWGAPQKGDLDVSQDERDVVRLYLEIWAQHGDQEAHGYLRSMQEGDLFGKEAPPTPTVEEVAEERRFEKPFCQDGRTEHHYCRKVQGMLLCCFCGAAVEGNHYEKQVKALVKEADARLKEADARLKADEVKAKEVAKSVEALREALTFGAPRKNGRR